MWWLSLMLLGQAPSRSFDLGLDEPPPPAVIETASVAKGPGLAVHLAPTEPRMLGPGLLIAENVARRLAPQLQLQVQSLEMKADPGRAERRKAEVEAALKEAERGIRAVEELDLEVAAASLEAAIIRLYAHHGWLSPSSRQTLASAVFAYAATALFEGNEEAADGLFVALAWLDRDFEPVEGRYPSNVAERFFEVVRTVETRPTGTLVVQTSPPGGAVYVNGLFRGYAPQNVSGLALGRHLVMAQSFGRKPKAALAELPEGGLGNVDLELDAAPGAEKLVTLDPLAALRPDDARAAAKLLDLQQLVLLRFDTPFSGHRTSGVWVTPDGLVAELPSTSVSVEPEVAADAIVAGLLQARALRLAPPPPPPPEAPLWGRWWFWAAVGGVVVVASTAVWAGTRPDEARPNNTAIFGF